MPAIPFDRLGGSARLWIFPATRRLDPAQAARLLAAMDDHLREWAAHGRPVVGGRDLRHGRFLLIAADEEASGVSGCSIDALFRRLATLESEMDLSLTDTGRVWYRQAGEIRSATRPEFRALAEEGQVDADTPVFNHLLGTVGELRAGRWEVPLRDSWHARAFPAALR